MRRKASPARLAHHAWAAGDAEAIVRHGLDAAHAAVAARSHREAEALLIHVLEYEHLLAARERAAALELLSEEAYYGNQTERAMSARQRALALRRELGEPLPTGATLRWLSRIHWMAGDGAAAERAAAEAVEQLESFPDSRELAMALSNRSQLAMLAQRDEDALRWGKRAIALARSVSVTPRRWCTRRRTSATRSRAPTSTPGSSSSTAPRRWRSTRGSTSTPAARWSTRPGR